MKSDNIARSLTHEARMLMSGVLDSEDDNSDDFISDIIHKMRLDKFTRTVKGDVLISKFGSALYYRYGKVRKNDISARMRHLARLLVVINRPRKHPLTLLQCINGKHFDRIVDSCVELCGSKLDETGRPVFERPSIGLKLGNYLVKCAQLKGGMGIRDNDKVTTGEADRYLNIHESEWKDKISCRALQTLRSLQLNNPKSLPLTSDLMKFREFLDERIDQLTSELRIHIFEYSVWRNLLELVLCSVIVFNKRRGGEASKLYLSAYKNRADWVKGSNQEILESLTPLERQLLNRFILCFYY